ncbi:MAG: radical SAM protein [Bacillota bacterium]
MNRQEGQVGYCQAGADPKVAKAFLHPWEEPCISGTRGSGTVFFSHCNMRCVFCQNYVISQQGFGKAVGVERLAEIFIELQERGAHNINLVTPTPYIPHISKALEIAGQAGLRIPVVYNTNGYESVEALESLRGKVSVFLPDLKYFDDAIARRYSAAPNYFLVATAAVKKMVELVGRPVFDADGIMQKGVIVRHLVLPGLVADSIKVLRWISRELKGDVLVSVMSQYVPSHRAWDYPELARRLAREEYELVLEELYALDLEDGFVQELDSADLCYTPSWDLEGV